MGIQTRWSSAVLGRVMGSIAGGRWRDTNRPRRRTCQHVPHRRGVSLVDKFGVPTRRRASPTVPPLQRERQGTEGMKGRSTMIDSCAAAALVTSASASAIELAHYPEPRAASAFSRVARCRVGDQLRPLRGARVRHDAVRCRAPRYPAAPSAQKSPRWKMSSACAGAAHQRAGAPPKTTAQRPHPDRRVRRSPTDGSRRVPQRARDAATLTARG